MFEDTSNPNDNNYSYPNDNNYNVNIFIWPTFNTHIMSCTNTQPLITKIVVLIVKLKVVNLLIYAL